MTLPPSTEYGIVGVKGPRYELGDVCSAPGCTSRRDDAHHIFRRSGLGTFSWVQMPDGRVVGNLTALCREHHDGITGRPGGHRFWIKWLGYRYVWGRVLPGEPGFPGFDAVAPLDPQPPVRESLDVSQPDDDEKPEPDRCPSCGQPRRRAPAIGSAGARRRKSWLVKVPDDHEDGAEVLDTLVDDLVPLLGLDPGASARYHVLVPVLVYAQQDKRSFVRAIAGVGGPEGAA